MLEEKSGTGRDRVTLVASSNNDGPRGLFPHPLPSPQVNEIALRALGSLPSPLEREGVGMRGKPPSPLALPREGGGGLGENLHVGWRGGVGSLARFIDRNPGAAVTLEIYCSANVQTEPFFGTPVRRGSPE